MSMKSRMDLVKTGINTNMRTGQEFETIREDLSTESAR